ncbi:VOC family protein [Microbacterium sp. USTB-Y]|uniref:VOC family protein n=1 Tax=Microbacterium sp. USTB-Y TaxID=2823692 RepID=UPI00203B46B1|nr:VOC family protein [Microbacterium sp. USTB-Y]
MRGFHHVELWVVDLVRAGAEWGWLLEQIGFEADDAWADGCSWRAGEAYLTICSAPALHGASHDRRLPGLNHLAFHGGSRTQVDALMAAAEAHGWRTLYGDRYPHAGGPDHYAGWLENSDGFKAEVVAGP